MKNIWKTFVLGLLAGFSISLGGLLFTIASSQGYKVIGSISFSIGLLLVCLFGFNLFTGKVGFTLEAKNKKQYLLDLLIMYVGNFVGALLIGFLCMGCFNDNVTIKTAIEKIAAVRENLDGHELPTFFGAIGCGMLVYTAVYGFKKDWPIGVRIFLLVFAVFAFVYAGFQHCIANMFYITFAGKWNGPTWVNILYVTVGNIVGALLLECITIIIKKLSIEKKVDDNASTEEEIKSEKGLE